MEPAQVVDINKSPILIVDRDGFIGKQLIEELKEESLIIFISKFQPAEKENIIYIPFKNTPAKIPDNNYSYIFLVDDESSWIRDSARIFAHKADYEKALLIFLTNIRIKEEKILSDISRFHRTSIMIMGDLFNKEKLLFDTLPNKFIFQARQEGRIDVPGDGTSLFYPVLFEDSIRKIIETVASEKCTSTNYVFSRHPVSHLTFAHSIQKDRPSLKIDFIKRKEKMKPVLINEGNFLFESHYDLKKSLKSVDIKKTSSSSQLKEVKVKTKRNKKRTVNIAKALLLIIILIIMPALLTLGSSFIGLKSLEYSAQAVKKGDLGQALNYAKFAKSQFYFAEVVSNVFIYQAEKLNIPDFSIKEKISLGKNIAETEVSFFQAVSLISQGNKKGELKNIISAAKNSLQELNKQIAVNKLEIKELEKYKDIFALASSTTEVWSDLLGFNGEKKYLVLFQNNMELRPGGGFIGSYAILTVDQGHVVEFKIHDVYDADGQLKGHVEPPFAVRRYLGKVHWYLRDSNFDVSFSESAGNAAYFLKLETGQEVDGVIGVDVTFVKNLLSEVGPVYVSDYKEKVDAGNLFYLTESHAEKDFFPGSTQKKDFLRSLFNDIQFKITQNKNISILPILSACQKSLNDKHLLFAFNDKSVQSIFSVNGWSSTVPTNFGKAELVDFFGISESNVGFNKVNYFVARSLSKTLSIDEKGNISSVLEINYKNSSDGKWPGGDYINYLRIILPTGSEITSINIDGKNQNMTPAITNFIQYEAKTFKPPTGLEVEKYSQSGKDIFGFLTNIPKGKLKTIKISYTLPTKINFSKTENNLKTYFFKQPGTEQIPINYSIKLPENLKFINLPKELRQTGDSAMFSQTVTSDINFNTRLAKD